MCGRFALNADGLQLQTLFDLKSVPNLSARYNIAPTQPIAVISNEQPDELTYYQWGLIPSWAKDASMGAKLINARSETLTEKPSFKNAYKRRRCLIPANGFYEWSLRPEDKKQPQFIHLTDQDIFAFAGLWETWQSPTGDLLKTCTIITTEANDKLQPYHHRQPVILAPNDYALWLSQGEVKSDDLMPLLTAYPSDKMAIYPVGKDVNSINNDNPSLMERFQPPRQQTLF
jgi:putative SOS response-associated peptidase YedK